MVNLYPSFFGEKDIRGRVEAGFDEKIIANICRGFATQIRRQTKDSTCILFAHSPKTSTHLISHILETLFLCGKHVIYFNEQSNHHFLSDCTTQESNYFRLYLEKDVPLHALRLYNKNSLYDAEALEELQTICEEGIFCAGQGFIEDKSV